MWTVRGLLKEAGAFLQRKAVPSHRLEAELLLAHALGVDRVGLYASFTKPLTADEVDAFREFVQRRIRGEPTAYITGTKEFFSLDFHVTPAVLIPRPETEELVQSALDAIERMHSGAAVGSEIHAADIGTGSGCIPVALAACCSDLRLVATDIAHESLEVAAGNAERHGVSDRIAFVQGSLVEPLLELRPRRRFHLITCNPPYVDPAGPLEVDPSVRGFEPDTALFTPSGDPLHFYRGVLEKAPDALEPGGEILFEVAMGMAGEVAGLGNDLGFEVVCRRKDLSGTERVVGFSFDAGGK
jgi:release factor glutamine methyltransferase